MSLSRVVALLLPHLAGVVAERIEVCQGRVVLQVRDRLDPVPCPGCGQESAKLNSWYPRRLADTAIGGRPVTIRLTARRLACGNPACSRKTFAAQIPGLTFPYARRTPPATGVLQAAGVALAGRAGARLAARLAIPASRWLLLRLVMALPDPPAGEPAEAGIDDFAFRRGRSYGTIVTNAATGQVIDVLPDREAATVQDWLAPRHWITVICRDRAGAYAQAARDGAPQAVQVADRWHIWHNLCKYAARAVARHRAELALTRDTPAPVTSEDQVTAVITARWDQVQAIRARGGDLTAAMTALGLGKATASRYWNAASLAVLLHVRAAASLDPRKADLRHLWEQGEHCIRELNRQITALGYTGGYGTTLAYLTRWKLAAPPPPPPPPEPRQATRLILTRPGTLTSADQALHSTILARCPSIAALASHITAFAAVLASRDTGKLKDWIQTVQADPGWPELHSFARGLQLDYDAVASAITQTWNSGHVEGNVCKLKLIKRQMYGRAAYPLLRKRVLLLSAPPP
jgi:transposase